MAKKKAPGTKTQAVMAYLAKNPDATASEVIPALANVGITTSQQLVSKIRSQLKKAGATKKRVAKKKAVKRRPAKKTSIKQQPAPKPKAVTAEDLFEAKRLADTLGGIAEARKALETLEQLR